MNEIIKAMEERRSIRKFKPEMPKLSVEPYLKLLKKPMWCSPPAALVRQKTTSQSKCFATISEAR